MAEIESNAVNLAQKIANAYDHVACLKVALKKPSQETMIFNYLLKGKCLTTLEALKMFGVFRLSERIREINARHGIKVISEMHKDLNTGKRYAKYHISAETIEKLLKFN